ncbi:hypothetical protein C2845_PM03G21530 [Panicum miliaceum]|uniref:DUF7769 domain-containing protein n=1 Tax=Panicum miliaceum TaxID=4540 RepID=A0A3L6T3W2_PANMI|nr:hypothetical protein C2845_PM03G21530 [Panicum miliaceum]
MAASVLLDLNCTPPEDSDGGITSVEGNYAAHEDANALAQEEGGDSVAADVGHPMRLRRWLTGAQRYAVYTSLHAKSRNGKLPKKATKEVATFFHAHIRVIQRIWRCAREQIALGQEVDVSNRRTGRVGRKKVQLDHSQMASIPLNRRSTLKSLAKSLDWTPPFRKLPAGAEPRLGTLQLCVANRCLVFQLARAGGTVASDCRKLQAHHGLEVASTLEICGGAGMGRASMEDMADTVDSSFEGALERGRLSGELQRRGGGQFHLRLRREGQNREQRRRGRREEGHERCGLASGATSTVKKEFLWWLVRAMLFDDDVVGVVGACTIAAAVRLPLPLLERGENAEARRRFLVASATDVGVDDAEEANEDEDDEEPPPMGSIWIWGRGSKTVDDEGGASGAKGNFGIDESYLTTEQ